MPYADREKQLAAQMRYYRENQELAMRQKRERRSQRLKFLQEYKATHPCADCGIQYPHYIMDFDHLPQFRKSFNLSGTNTADRTMKKLLEEIEKCEVVCANCHRHRTVMRLSLADLEDEVAVV